jgi:Tol biopolymer transport system component
MLKIILRTVTLAILATLISCGGGGFTTPDTNGSTRFLGIEFGIEVPSLIAFSRATAGYPPSPGDLFVMFPDGTHQKRLTSGPWDDNFPTFSPEGLSLAFASNRNGQGFGNHDVYRLKSPSKIVPLTDQAWQFDCTGLAWGPDWILSADNNTLIMGTLEVVRLTKIDPAGEWTDWIDTGKMAVYDPAISRDGKNIAYISWVSFPPDEHFSPTSATELFLVKTGETESVQLTNYRGNWEYGFYIRNPEFSPSGRQIVFNSNLAGLGEQIGLLSLDEPGGPRLVGITGGFGSDVEPSFSPDGKFIVFARYQDGNYELYKTANTYVVGSGVPWAVADAVRLTNTPEDERNPDWSVAY